MVEAARCVAGSRALAERISSDAAWARLDLDPDGFLSAHQLQVQRAVALPQDMRAGTAMGLAQSNRYNPRSHGPVAQLDRARPS